MNRAGWAAAAVLVGLAAWAASGPASRALGEGAAPQLVVLAAGPVERPWSAGWDGRPREPVVLAVSATLARRDGGDEPASVLGLAGPGIVAPADGDLPAPVAVPATATERHPVTVALSARIDCAAVLDAAAGSDLPAYRLRVAAGAGPGTGPGTRPGRGITTADAGVHGRAWADAVRLGCATWAARRDLTVTAVTARIDPTRPEADLVATVADAGPWAATLAAPTAGLRDVVVPAHGTATVPLHVRLDRCDVVGSVRYGTVGTPVLSSRLGLVALVGAGGSGRTVTFASPGDGTAPTGVVLARAAGEALGTALGRACGDVGPPSASILPGGVHYDPATGELAVTAQVQITPPVVRSLTLQPESGPATALWTTTPELLPDPSGRVQVTLRYRLPATDPCGTLGAGLFGVVATLHRPEAGGDRVVRYSVTLDLAQDGRLATTFCDRR